MNEERVMILQMVKEGKISLEEADRLLEALNKTEQANVRPTGPKAGSGQPFDTTNLSNLGVQIGRMVRDEITRAVRDPHNAQTVREVMNSLKSAAHEIKHEVKNAMRDVKVEMKNTGVPTSPNAPTQPTRQASNLSDEIESCMDEVRDWMHDVDDQKKELDEGWREFNAADPQERQEIVHELRGNLGSLYSICAETTKKAGDLASLAAKSSDSDRKMADELIRWANESVERAMKRGKEIEALVDEMATLESMDQTKGLDDLQNPPSGR